MDASSKEGRVVLNCLNPGHCRTEMMRDSSGLYKLFIAAMTALMARTAEVGSRTLVAGVEAGEEMHGQYMNDCKVGKSVSPVRRVGWYLG